MTQQPERAYYFGGESREESDHYAVLVCSMDGNDYSVMFYKDGSIQIVSHGTDPQVAVDQVAPIINAVLNDAQVTEQINLFRAGLPCCDLTDM